MNKKIEDFIKKFITVMHDCDKFCFITRGEEFQKKAIEELINLENEAKDLKDKFIKLKDESSANILLSLESLIKTKINEFKMLLALKKDKPDKAWDFLIDAQSYARRSMQASVISELNQEGYIKKLFLMEKILFPPQTFLSPGIVVQGTKCSICGKDYDKCNHLVGKAYMGKICYRIVKKIKELKEMSIVEEPANKHARVTSLGEKNAERNTMTWRLINKQGLNDKI